MTKSFKALCALTAVGLCAWSLPAAAAVTIDIREIGSDVIATSIGSIDLTGLTLITETTYTSASALRPTDAFVATGSATTTNGYSGITGPRDIGFGSVVNATSGSGTPFGLNIFPVNRPAGLARLFLPLNYVSGQSIEGSATFANATLQSLGLTVGQYTYAAPNDSVVINVVASAVPEPATWTMILAGFGMIGFAVRRRSSLKTNVRLA